MARRVGLVAALLLLLILPLFELAEWQADGIPEPLMGLHTQLRGILVILALVFLALRLWRPGGLWPRPLLLAMGTGLVGMMIALYFAHYMLDSDYLPTITSGLMMAVAAAALLAISGARDLSIVYGLPTTLLLIGLWWLDMSRLFHDPLFYHPFIMMVIGVIMAELYHRIQVQSFLLNQELHEHAVTDPLTGLHNRRSIDRLLDQEHGRAVRHGHSYSVIMADLDRFKRVNDDYGHDVGDEVLRTLATRLKQSIRKEDHTARWGGEEFVILLPDTGTDAAMAVAEKIRQQVGGTPFTTRAGPLPITISLGVSTLTGDASPADLITRADHALYQAKTSGRDRAVAG